jgi:hypothetical protein
LSVYIVCIRYSTIETKEAARIGYNGFLFPHQGRHLSTNALYSGCYHLFALNPLIPPFFTITSVYQIYSWIHLLYYVTCCHFLIYVYKWCIYFWTFLSTIKLFSSVKLSEPNNKFSIEITVYGVILTCCHFLIYVYNIIV